MKIGQKRVVRHVSLVDLNLQRPENIRIESLRIRARRQQSFLIREVHGRGPSEARPDGQNDTIGASQTVSETRYVGARAYNAHMANQNVEELWKFVDLETP